MSNLTSRRLQGCRVAGCDEVTHAAPHRYKFIPIGGALTYARVDKMLVLELRTALG